MMTTKTGEVIISAEDIRAMMDAFDDQIGLKPMVGYGDIEVRHPRPSWDDYAMNLAAVVATRSEDPWLKVGAVLLRPDHSVASVGYNGSAPGAENIDWYDRDGRRKYVIHAEVNALRYATPHEIEFCVSTTMPCTACMAQLAAFGVKRVAYRDHLPSTVYNEDDVLAVARASGITVYQWPETK